MQKEMVKWKAKTDERLIGVYKFIEWYAEPCAKKLMTWKARVEQQMLEISDSLSVLHISKHWWLVGEGNVDEGVNGHVRRNKEWSWRETEKKGKHGALGDRIGTAYFLGLKRTYKLALKIQRRVVSRNHPRFQQFVQRRTRAVFDVALKVIKSIQHRDLELRAPTHHKPHHIAGRAFMNIPKQVTNSTSLKTSRIIQSLRNNEASRHLFRSSTNMWSNSFPTMALMMQPSSAAGNMTQCRHSSSNGPNTLRLNYMKGEGVIRKDIMQWMLC
ncbi:hypothetical protein V6N13_046913 [Hibiscus sabdariffa]